MGCRISKADEPSPLTPAVALCRDRRDLIRAAADRRRSLAGAHAAYFSSLSAMGDALLRFVQNDISTPVLLTLPPPSPDAKKSKSDSNKSGSGSEISPPSNSGSVCLSDPNSPDQHSHFHSESDYEEIVEEEEESLEKNNARFRENQPWRAHTAYYNPNSFPNIGTPNFYYMKSSSTVPTTVYQQPYSDYTNQSYMSYGYDYNYPMYGFNLPPERIPTMPMANSSDKGERISIESPPPPAPEVSGWDFFNPFDSYDQTFNTAYRVVVSDTSSPNSSEVREREGIPELEEETEQESIKGSKNEEIKSETKSSSKDESESVSEIVDTVGENKHENENESEINNNNNNNNNNNTTTTTVEKGTANEEERENKVKVKVKRVSFEGDVSVVQAKSNNGTRDVEEAVREIKQQFVSLSCSGEEVANILEVGSVPYRSRNRVLRLILVKILDALSLVSSDSTRSAPKNSPKSNATTLKLEGATCTSGTDKVNGVDFNSLSCILDRLHTWEKRLYKEVKEEEKLRVIYEREWKRLKALDASGAEAHQIDSARASIKSLLTRISMAIRSIKYISNRIHKLRDDELQPNLVELFQGLMKMWRLILDSHRRQFQAVLESKPHELTSKSSIQLSPSISPSPAYKTTLELELELLNWSSSFRNWIQAQRAYIETLNQYLLKWLPQEKQDERETPDGIPPFSPSRLCAPAVFVTANDWAHVSERASDSAVQVLDTMRAFALNVHLLLERQDLEREGKLRADYLSKDLAKRVRSLQRGQAMDRESELGKMRGETGKFGGEMMVLDGLKRRVEMERAKYEEAVGLVREAGSGNNLKTGLGPIFEALESFSLEVVKGFEGVRVPNGEAVT